IAAQRDGEIMCQAAEELGFDNDICGYARISLAYAAGKRASRKLDLETGEFVIDPNSGKPLKDENGNVVIDEATGKPKKDPKTMKPYIVIDDIHEIEALPEGREKELRRNAIQPYKQMRIPQPDFVLCCNNICNCMTKWYENIARMCDIPLIMIDVPYNNTVEVNDDYVAYIRAQFDNAIKDLEKLTGRKFDEKKFDEACKHANRTAQNWLKVCDYLQYKPAPMSGFDLFNHMADVVTARGKSAAADAFELLSQDLEKNIREGTSTLPFPERYRVMFEGIPCWPKLPNLFKPLKANGVNVTAVVYAPAFGFVYNNYDEMVKAYCKAPNSVCIEQGVDWREGICRENKVDGVLVHYNRSCKPWSGYMAEMQRRFTRDLGIPCAGFDGDQADPRNFNEAQYETRVQGLVEAMQANQK
ncbi:MAG: 2-hydroxyacyl-CoA dehydratase, partial [Synergistaceae bacterium]|nr:2-hydroxyacyl-CoA dehydratase [Synergistaceae bacterium]